MIDQACENIKDCQNNDVNTKYDEMFYMSFKICTQWGVFTKCATTSQMTFLYTLQLN